MKGPLRESKSGKGPLADINQSHRLSTRDTQSREGPLQGTQVPQGTRCNGLRLVDRNLHVLAEFQRDAAHGRHGYPEASMFDQPELEALLRAGLTRHPAVTMRGGVEVASLAPEAGGVRVAFTDSAGRPDSVLAQYVFGCDGANSLTRTAVGAVMRDLGFTQRWLVVDLRTDAELGVWEGVYQVSDPARAATYMRIGQNRYRWEFQLAEGETADDYRAAAALLPLIKPWTGDVLADDFEIVRVAEYTFRAQVADRWRDRRVFLLGDAAHLTPPFIGQGMGAGMRDAMNLAWKLAGVLDGTLSETVLDSYETERKPHATAMIRLAKLMGAAMTEGGEFGGLLRRVAAPRLHLVPGLRRRVLATETPALRRSALVARPRLRRSLAGRQCPNAPVDGRRRLDEVTAGRFAVICAAEPSPAQRADIEKRGAVLVVARPRSPLYRWLRRGFAYAAVIRPDATVHSAGRDLDALCAAIPPYRTREYPANLG
ncbi:bifunctional 3-(3-hydroxy-phenyl)propionate/3-hydroxycinnamic acid hydroxylase [Amycolatopsis benzoatilytica]|uniref:bifunctional 3-(3-hydroxy-phenyl)propionate/3-hydroxycinnamic acid hydroxylase n=1 Tax=Amycolatopsis benzoatilytica TaxID=346045 RepID=UPI00039D665F|nr:bifunctional 3-(3-hydroxy-phenyl)propionate/3-hydroxycinnamic acid hydroxylase [Amycolatopsis benzoatilytica]